MQWVGPFCSFKDPGPCSTFCGCHLESGENVRGFGHGISTAAHPEKTTRYHLLLAEGFQQRELQGSIWAEQGWSSI